MVVLGGKIIDTNFHADYKNPIPIFALGALRPAISRLAPLHYPGVGTCNVNSTAQRGFDRFHKVTLNGKELETRFVSGGELEATIPCRHSNMRERMPSWSSARATSLRAPSLPISSSPSKNEEIIAHAYLQTQRTRFIVTFIQLLIGCTAFAQPDTIRVVY